jgi:hypothetical protein
MRAKLPTKRQKTDSSADLTPTLILSVFVYTGVGVPKNVVCVQFDPSVVEVPEYEFHGLRYLKEVVLNEGLQKIGGGAFDCCELLESITLFRLQLPILAIEHFPIAIN